MVVSNREKDSERDPAEVEANEYWRDSFTRYSEKVDDNSIAASISECFNCIDEYSIGTEKTGNNDNDNFSRNKSLVDSIDSMHDDDSRKNGFSRKHERDKNPEDECCFGVDCGNGMNRVIHRITSFIALRNNDIFAGISTSLNQIPEVMCYALLSGIKNPMLGIQSTWIMNLSTSLIGGSSGMISGLTASVAILIGKLVSDPDVGSDYNYIPYTVMLAGLLQAIIGLIGLDLLRLVPHPVKIGFVNSAGIIIALAQISFFKDQADKMSVVSNSWSLTFEIFTNDDPWRDLHTLMAMILLAFLSFSICEGLHCAQNAKKRIPSGFIALVIATLIEQVLRQYDVDLKTPLLGEYFEIKEEKFPIIIFFDNTSTLPPFSKETFGKIYLYSLSLLGVTWLESMMTGIVIDDLTKSQGSRSHVAVSQGASQLLVGLFGGIGGAAMIGQSVVNCRTGATTSLSGVVGGVSLMLFCSLKFFDFIKFVPVSALVGLMYYAVFHMIQWGSFLCILGAIIPQSLRVKLSFHRKIQRMDAFTILLVMIISILYGPSVGVASGICIAVFAYAWDSSNRILVERKKNEDCEHVTYFVAGPIFFGTGHLMLNMFTEKVIKSDPVEVLLSLEGAEIFDWSGMVAIKSLYDKLTEAGKTVAIGDISRTSKTMMEKNSFMWKNVNFVEIPDEVKSSLRTKSSKMSL